LQFVTIGLSQIILKRRNIVFPNLHNGVGFHIQVEKITRLS
jgi:hypothetical protein